MAQDRNHRERRDPIALHRATIVSFSAGSFLAVVRLDGSTPTTLTNVRCSRLDSAVFTAGRKCIVDTGDHGDATDAVITTVFT